MLSRLAVPIALALTLASPAFADTASFNFETKSTSSGLTTLSDTSNGLTMTLTRPGGTFGISNQSGNTGLGFPVSWGARTLSPFENNSNTGFLADFSAGVTGFGIEWGDYGADADLISIVGYDGVGGTGNIVFSATSTLPFTDSTFHSGSFSVSGIPTAARSVTFIGGSVNFPNSLYWDNITATFETGVPEPTSWALMLLGFLGIGSVARRRRAAFAAAA